MMHKNSNQIKEITLPTTPTFNRSPDRRTAPTDDYVKTRNEEFVPLNVRREELKNLLDRKMASKTGRSLNYASVVQATIDEFNAKKGRILLLEESKT